jgi:hypothetical protein
MTTSVESPAKRLVTLPRGIPVLTLGWEFIRAATKYLRQPNGPRAGTRFAFVDSQVRFLLWWYAVDESGNWLFHHGVRRLAKGSGKSPFTAIWAIGELCFPVRLKDFDLRVPGGCVGQPVTMPLVQIAATAESQTANTMRMVRAFAPKGSRLVQEFHLDPGKTQYFKQPEGTLQVITSSPTAAEGAEVTAVVGDETEHWKPANGGVELSSTLADNLAKSGSRMLTNCNSWVPGQETVAEADWKAWVGQEEGLTNSESRILYDARIAPPDTDMSDPESLQRGLDFVYDDCWWVDRRAVMVRIYDLRSNPDDSKRKYLNRPTSASDAWVTQEQVELLFRKDRVVAPGEDVVLFFDGSKSRDATGLVGCCLSDGHVFVVGAWEPDPNDDDDVVPVVEVDARVAYAFRTWSVQGFFADVKEWESFTKVTWPELYKDQLGLWAVPGGKDPQSIAWDMRTHTFDFTQACELTLMEIEGKQFTIDGDARLVRHLTNARRRPNRYGVSIGKETPDSPDKIDLAVCVVGARMVRRLVLNNPKRKRKRSGRVW